MSECTHNCETCGADCASRTAESLLAPQNELSDVKKVIAVVSGKGGVGKSLVTALMANAARNKGKTAAILDADVTGPSVPKLFGIRERAQGTENSLFPVQTSTGIRVMSVNLLLENETDPVVWRGPVIAGVIKQFWSDVIWDKVDYMFVDMPPGTGDVPLTVFQSLPVDGIIVVTSPQELVGMIVEKSVRMAAMMEKKVLGLVENMSYLECPDCGRRIEVFGPSRADELAERHGIPVVCRLPIDPEYASAVDKGRVETIDCPALAPLVDAIAGA